MRTPAMLGRRPSDPAWDSSLLAASMDVPEQLEAYLASQPEPKQADLRRLHAHILAEFPGCRLWFTDGTNADGKVVANPNIGYGAYTITYADGSSREFYRIGLSLDPPVECQCGGSGLLPLRAVFERVLPAADGSAACPQVPGPGSGFGVPFRACGCGPVGAGQAAICGGPQAAYQRLRHSCSRCQARGGGNPGVGVLPLACSAACPGFLGSGSGVRVAVAAVGVRTGSGLVRPLRRAGRRPRRAGSAIRARGASPRAGAG